ncbi:type VI secretion system Vgr family protein [Achromobacter sp. ACRQX]|uniref:type VI secretion system Vgr family protein n=1 Tax=Achromobacter sp. ACRQX TaxID=2918181 RepID=UPI001EF19B2A|nr:type VI secretion system Vgr family protein [Achromobacter sp. ACRQX]MCG7328133.1 type VI secretion system tip protein VgrG [Achromobacter sp. ACRQX]
MALESAAAGPLGAGFTQADRLLDLATPLGPDTLLAERLQGREQLSGGGFVLDVDALSGDAHIPLKSLIGQSAQVKLQTALGRDEHRVWCGVVTEARFEGANGGFARYRLRIEPWLALLRQRRDSFAFQDLSVIDIVDSVFGDYKGQGALAPQWRWEVKDRDAYAKRSLTIQYRETDFAFVERLLAEEGLFYWVEHEGGDGEPGTHTIVIADHNGAFETGPQDSVSFQRADATEEQDSIQAWRQHRAWRTNAVRLATWDYRAMQARKVSAQVEDKFANALELADSDYPGQYLYEDSAQGERLAHNALAAQRVRQSLFEGEGTVRTLAPGQRFTLTGHWGPSQGAGADFVVIGIRHEARNNFDESFGQAVAQALGAAGGGAVEKAEGEAADFYRNRFEAIAATLEYRPSTRDGHGARLHPRPTVHGAQTALVVGAGDSVHTDRDHRIKIQFHWQRGSASSSRQDHPAGEDNAPASEALGTWVRVAEPVAGSDWGGHFVPRLGQEVLVQFLHGDIDRPVVVGALYNGAGTENAANNQVQGGAAKATGNAPAWFAGSEAGHAHNVVMSGFKTQALASSGQGMGGYNQLVQDDTPGQSRLTASTTQAESRLNLGHLKQQRDNERLSDLGHGAELATAEALALRAGEGLLISAHKREDATGGLLDSEEAIQQMEKSIEQAAELSATAGRQEALLPGDNDKPRALNELNAVREIIEGTKSDAEHRVPAYTQPHVQVSAPSGIGQYTPHNAYTVAGATLCQIAPDVNWAAGANLAMCVAQGVALFTKGLGGSGRAVQEQGIRLHAAGGKLRLQSQKARMRLAAEKAVTLASAQGAVDVNASKKVLATAAGAYMRIEGGGIQLHAPGKVELKAGVHNWVGPQSGAGPAQPPQGDMEGCAAALEDAAGSGALAA